MRKPIELISPSFSSDFSQQYSLSIRQFPNGYSFCVKAIDENKCLAIKYLPFESHSKTASLLKDEPLLQQDYKSVTYWGYGAYLFLPNKLEYDNYTPLLPIPNTIKRRSETKEKLISQDIRVIFQTNRWIYPKTDNIELIHEIEMLFSVASNHTAKSGVWVEILENHINIIILSDKELKLGNTYQISTGMDIAFYILACYQQLKLSTEVTPLFLYGKLPDEEVTNVLKSYLRKMQIYTPLLWDNKLNEESQLNCFTLQIMEEHICE